MEYYHLDKKPVGSNWFCYFAPRFIIFTALVGLLTRLILLFVPPTVIGFSFVEWVKIFLLGFVNDFAFSVLALAPALLIHATLNDAKYTKPYAIGISTVLLGLVVYAFLPDNIFKQYGSVVPAIAQGLFSVLLLCYLLRLLLPGIRKTWCRVGVHAVMGIYVFLMLVNMICEIVFWYEFGVRYNFIAVDYLMYTNEVIGNIFESYNIVPMFIGVLVAAVAVAWLMFRQYEAEHAENKGLLRFSGLAVVYAVVLSGSLWWMDYSYRNLQSDNSYATELQCNGCWNFLEAYSSSSLDYAQFYRMLPENEVRSAKLELCGQDSTGVRHIVDAAAPVKKNIVLIVIESMSADFLSAYGNKRGITPNLDSLMKKSLVLDNFYAAGNRSVRGLEAYTLCIPPSAGESIVKRPIDRELFSTGDVLRELGYTSTFYYGGESYFDNMRSYFTSAGFEIHDKNDMKPEEITFANIWGTCDEDSFMSAINDFDRKAESGQPFHGLIFTISNHRPYTFPEGKIEYDGEMKSRRAAVKYTDYAVGRFFEEASKRAWFDNTVFIVTADHCASSAGKTSVPVDKYHIPALIYAPGFIEPQRVSKVCSQIDLMPTVFSLLHFSYDSKFYGRDILAPDFNERAFMATYQDLGFLKDSVLTVLSPVGRVHQYDVVETEPHRHTENLRDAQDETLALEGQVFYQSVNLGY